MLVTKTNFDKALLEIRKSADIEKALGYDTETTCLPFWNQPWYAKAGIYPRVFSIQIATKETEFYFDFNHSAAKLNDAHFNKLNSELAQDPALLWFIANAPFDINHSANHGIEFKGTIHCTKGLARVVNNLEPSLSLDDLGEKYLGVGKLDVITLLKERGHLTQIKKFGHNEKYDECLHFDRLELGELVDYGKKDTRLCFDLGVWQIRKILELDRTLYKDKDVKLSTVMENEQKLTKVIAAMAREGVLIDRKYTEEAYEYEVAEYKNIELQLNKIAGKNVDWLSAKQLKPIFDAANEPYSYTEKGNASFDKDALEESESQLAKLILQYRFHNKRAHTYFENFIWLADDKGIVHADAQQAGTQFGRMSYWNPNLQNIPKRTDKEETKYKVRRCFIPKPGTFFGDFDYKGAEYYMAMDYAREMPVIEMLKAGLDPHGKLAKDMNLAGRDPAKTMQFRILYGAGGPAIGKSLGYKGEEAKQIGYQKKKEYFNFMPKVAELLAKVSSVARSRGYIFNWLGRKLDYDRNTAYKAPNGLIQSGVGDMTKKAQTTLYFEKLQGFKSCMLIQVHDALLFQLYYDELHLIPIIKETMCNAYPHKVLPMQSDVGFSEKSWADLGSEIPAASRKTFSKGLPKEVAATA